MNERMYELINEAFIGTTDGKLSPINTVANVERFAELIVRECCDWIEGSPTSESGCQLLLTKSFIIANLKGHFGV